MKLGWTRFWVRVSALLAVANSFAPAFCASAAAGQGEAPKRRNELTLAGVRPGQDLLSRMIQIAGAPTTKLAGDSARWLDVCNQLELSADLDEKDRVQVVRLQRGFAHSNCVLARSNHWRTGRGLRLYDACNHTVALYGNPDSRGPSTRDGQPLELLYYSFDWAGPDVPQVMQVVCTVEKDGQGGRVVQITLAASGL